MEEGSYFSSVSYLVWLNVLADIYLTLIINSRFSLFQLSHTSFVYMLPIECALCIIWIKKKRNWFFIVEPKEGRNGNARKRDVVAFRSQLQILWQMKTCFVLGPILGHGRVTHTHTHTPCQEHLLSEQLVTIQYVKNRTDLTTDVHFCWIILAQYSKLLLPGPSTWFCVYCCKSPV